MSGLDGDENPRARDEGSGDPHWALGAQASKRDEEIRSANLLQGRREIVIRHAGQRYRLRITANDKLILTK
ncbi:hemin uptake protein HemP [Methylobacterium sp. J-048]|uniref:hemin uptake protein HemP n=1 Tax=Methylobacterium sp. J-048 TaxID=2836635 RepID=UPI002444AD5D|nr:hemin uptake protein HemP [Methylobacterium sp. J-048]